MEEGGNVAGRWQGGGREVSGGDSEVLNKTRVHGEGVYREGRPALGAACVGPDQISCCCA